MPGFFCICSTSFFTQHYQHSRHHCRHGQKDAERGEVFFLNPHSKHRRLFAAGEGERVGIARKDTRGA